MPGPLDQLLTALGGIAAGAGQPGMAGRMWQEVAPWVQRLVVEAGPKWVPRFSFGFECNVPVMYDGQPVGDCPNNAVAACCACNKPVCLAHSMIDCHGDAICYLCVAVARDAQRELGGRPPPVEASNGVPSPAQVVQAMRVLGVDASTPWDEVRRAARKRSGRYHPDNLQTGDAEKFKAVRAAFDLLERDRAARNAA